MFGVGLREPQLFAGDLRLGLSTWAALRPLGGGRTCPKASPSLWPRSPDCAPRPAPRRSRPCGLRREGRSPNHAEALAGVGRVEEEAVPRSGSRKQSPPGSGRCVRAAMSLVPGPREAGLAGRGSLGRGVSRLCWAAGGSCGSCREALRSDRGSVAFC